MGFGPGFGISADVTFPTNAVARCRHCDAGRYRRALPFCAENFPAISAPPVGFGKPAVSPAPLLPWWRSRIVIESFRAFAHDAPPDETFERTQRSVILRSNETDRIANRMGAASSSNPMDVILGVHRKIVIHNMRNSIDIDSARCNIGRHQHPHGARFEILQRSEPLILRTVRMDRSRLDSACFEPTRDAVGAMFRAGKDKNGIELRIGQQMKKQRGLQVRSTLRKQAASPCPPDSRAGRSQQSSATVGTRGSTFRSQRESEAENISV